MSSIALNYKKDYRIAITPGDPAGIGPDILLDYIQNHEENNIIAYADPELLRARADLLGCSTKIEKIAKIERTQIAKKNTLFVYPIPLRDLVKPGVPNPKNSGYVLNCLDYAIEHTINGHIQALVTGPINKMLINKSGRFFTGHTEYIASKLNIKNPVMMLVNEKLKVVVATTHIPLSDVPKQITQKKIETVIQITESELKDKFKIVAPKIAVCGLNPHAGEEGHVGSEENLVIKPVIIKLQGKGLNIEGPLPADTIFAFEKYKKYDVIVAMYHDQGLAPFKALAFGEAVNITLGLPIIRTSVDHGTAFDKAATGSAHSSSLKAAIKVAENLLNR